jgi:hypothetical protein
MMTRHVVLLHSPVKGLKQYLSALSERACMFRQCKLEWCEGLVSACICVVHEPKVRGSEQLEDLRWASAIAHWLCDIGGKMWG